MIRHTFATCLVVLLATSAAVLAGQAAAPPPLAFPVPAEGITVSSDLEYGVSGTTHLAMDVYRPPMAAGAKVPALIFLIVRREPTGANDFMPHGRERQYPKG